MKGSTKKPFVFEVLRDRGVFLKSICETTGYNTAMIYRALNTDRFHTMGHGHLMRIRAAIENAVIDRGWKGNPSDLWAEFEHAFIEKHAA